MDEEERREAALEPVRQLFFQIVALADAMFGEGSEPARSRMIHEARYLATSHIAYHAPKWFSDEAQRKRFVEELKANVALVSAVCVESPSEDEETLRSAFQSMLDLREREYRAVRAAYHNRLFRLLLGEKFVDEVFLTERIRHALNEAKASPPPGMSDFVRRTVREVHQSRAAISQSSMGSSSDAVRRGLT